MPEELHRVWISRSFKSLFIGAARTWKSGKSGEKLIKEACQKHKRSP